VPSSSCFLDLIIIHFFQKIVFLQFDFTHVKMKRVLFSLLLLLPAVLLAQENADSLFQQFESGSKSQRTSSTKELIRFFEKEELYDRPVPAKINPEHKFSEMLVRLGMGIYELNRGDFNQATTLGLKAEKLIPKDSLYWLATCYELLDAAYLWQGDYPKCIEYAQKDYEVGEQLGDDHIQSAALNALAAANCYTRLYDKALEYINRAIEIERNGDDDKALSVRLGIKCEVLLLMGRPDEALEVIEEAIAIDQNAGREEKVAIRLSQKADILADKGLWEECRTTCLQSLANLEKTGNVKEQIIVLKQLGGCETQLKMYDSAEKHLLESERLCHETGFRSQLWRVQKRLSTLYKETGHPEKALNYLELSSTLNDSLSEERQQKIIAEYQTRFEVKEKEQELEAQRTATRNRSILSLAFLIIAIMTAIIAYSSYKLAKIRQKRNQDLAEINILKDRIFAIISHDLKNPLRAQSQLLSYLNAHYDEVDDDTKKKQIQALKDSGNRLNEMLTNLLDWARIELKHTNTIPMRVDLTSVIRKNIQLIQPLADNKQITITSNLEGPYYAFSDLNALETILRNLLSNAVKFSHNGGSIEIITKAMADSASLSIVDHGVGMNEAQKKSVFNMQKLTTLGTNEETGTGLGLIVCKSMTDKIHGCLTFESTEGEGSTFTLTIPLTEEAYNKNK